MVFIRTSKAYLVGSAASCCSYWALVAVFVVGSECAGCEREAAHSQEDEVSLWEGGWSRQLGVVSCG